VLLGGVGGVGHGIIRPQIFGVLLPVILAQGLATNLGGVLGTSPAIYWERCVQQTLGVPLAESARMFVPRWNIVVAYWTAAVEPILDAATQASWILGQYWLPELNLEGVHVLPYACLLVVL
jgi:hypothetical protein